MSKRAIGVGDADIDIYLQVDHIPGRDEKVLAQSVELYPGGMVANMLAALARLGTPCAFHGPVGDDEYGRMTLADLEANGVDIGPAVVKPGQRTYFCTVMLDASGEKALIVAPTPCLFPQPDDVAEAAMASAQHLHTTAARLDTTARAIRFAKKHGLTVSLDLEPTAARQSQAVLPLLAMVDLVFVNERALALLGHEAKPATAAAALLDNGSQVVCVTRGARGSLTFARGKEFATPAFAVPVVDSTGAGDCFAAGFVHGWLEGWSLETTARFASAVAALSIGQRGGHAGAPTPEQVQRFLQRAN